jgi:hypothetical protein
LPCLSRARTPAVLGLALPTERRAIASTPLCLAPPQAAALSLYRRGR